MSFFAIVWSIWLLRNSTIFNGKALDFEEQVDIIKYRLASWFKARWPKSPHSISDIVRSPKEISIPTVKKVSKRCSVWEPPPLDFLKFNVDGSAKGKPGAGGIGGVLRDNNAVVKIVFSKSIGIADSNMVELLAVREALKVFVASRWASSHKLIIESVSSNVVNWMLNPSESPWVMKRFVAQMEYLKQQLLGCDFVFTPREGNNMADALAKSGVARQNDLVVSYE